MQIDGENIPRCVVPMLYPWDGAHYRSRGYSGTLIEDLAQTVEEARKRAYRALYRSGVGLKCVDCGKELTPATNGELCPNSLSWHGRHSVAVVGQDFFWLAYTLHQDAVVGCSRDRETAKAQAVAKGVPEPVMRCVAVS